MVMFILGDALSWRCSVMEMLCHGDALSWRCSVMEMFCLEVTLCRQLLVQPSCSLSMKFFCMLYISV